jgi:hypothetical protein
MGLQIALTFDLGVLQDYGLPTKIDPLRDRFIGIILGVCIISIVFSLVWPESAQAIAREKLAACLRTIARLLHLGGSNDGSRGSSPQREQLELEIASRLSEANSFEEQAAFEAMLCGSKAPDGPNLENAIAAVDEIYVACLPWLRVQTPSTDTIQAGGHPKDRQELSGSLARRTEKLAHRLEPENFRAPGSTHFQTEAHERFESDASDHDESSDSRGLVTLVRALAQVETLLEATKKGG